MKNKITAEGREKRVKEEISRGVMRNEHGHLMPGTKGINPNGRGKGTKLKSTKIRERLRACEDDITEVVIKMALQGNEAMLKLASQYIWPAIRRDNELIISSEENTSKSRSDAIVDGVVEGSITPYEGKSALEVIGKQHDIHTIEDMNDRLKEMEEKIK